jgi:Ni,Fe-hydrogenase III small subunit
VDAVKTVYSQVLGPKAVIAIGSCPATTNVFIDSRTLDGPLDKHLPVDVFVPGCPPRPDAIIAGVARAADILAARGNNPPATAIPLAIVDEAGVPADKPSPAELQEVKP